MTKVIGLTGGIGSGKSTVARYFEELGVPVYYADDAAKEVMKTPAMLVSLQNIFGNDVVIDGVLDRKKLSTLVFSDKNKLETLNSLVHPAVRKHFRAWLDNYKDVPFVIREAAILFESGSYKDCEKVITVTAPFETKIERVMQRDSVTRQDVIYRMENQWSDEKKASLSDFIIVNIDLEATREEVVKIFKTLKKL
ncbi:dephospho-CoA kinase [Flavobacterium sp. MAH-1]|uniref:Dephospho-CoA kinase n=1 Tax=Flavobacterium agri TaxID=2743471 RepID=A0A7Y8Y4C1_9FLAO|nr:dephospho-CoA kinase [Flavobacterium agri]NUY82272.1 dephospho-CoA kinase [Flavobacterium agri]NYA72296.1 dephospho-CoA kinase [Flavobacterium agri]